VVLGAVLGDASGFNVNLAISRQIAALRSHVSQVTRVPTADTLQAQAQASTALTTADDAQTTAVDAQTAAGTAATAASDAHSLATSANSLATTAQSTAESASTDASTALAKFPLATADIATAAVTPDKLGVVLGGGNMLPNSSFKITTSLPV